MPLYMQLNFYTTAPLFLLKCAVIAKLYQYGLYIQRPMKQFPTCCGKEIDVVQSDFVKRFNCIIIHITFHSTFMCIYYTYTNTHINTHTHTYTHQNTKTHSCTCTNTKHTHAHTHTQHRNTCTHAHLYTRMYTDMHMYMYTHLL